MPKMRIHELAKELNVSSKDIISLLKKLEVAVDVKNHMSSINEESFNEIRELVKKEIKNKNITNMEDKEELESTEELEEIKIIKIEDKITVKELSQKLDKQTTEIIKNLMKMGIMANINQDVDFNTAQDIAKLYNIELELTEEDNILEKEFFEDCENEELKEVRPPVIVVMGHVDHGKTSLLDYIRKSKVTKSEAGGITQHIGAYSVLVNNNPVTFLDTPGHEAFTAMRMRGASVTDIAVLVVAADDGIKPQTIEAINHAKAADIEIIVAINKIDKPGANIDKVKQELIEFDLQAEDWGGSTICVPVSAIQGTGVDELLEMIVLLSELKELKANYNKPARGVVIEATLDKSRGIVATLLVKEGSLKVGDPIVVGSAYGKVRAMTGDRGQKVLKAEPSMPIEILGLSKAPIAGDTFYVAKNEKHARQLAESVIAKGRKNMIKLNTQRVSLDDLFNQIQEGNIKELNLLVKADVQGSAEALNSSLEKLSNEEVRIKIIHCGVGAITETDVMLASASNAIIIGFNVRLQPSSVSVVADEKVDVRLYSVIYNAIDDISQAMKGLLEPIYKEKVIGNIEIRQIFKASGVGNIAGSYILSGKITRNANVRIIRDSIVIYDGTIAALKRFKDDAKEVNAGYECGILFENFNDIKEEDKVEAYIMEKVPR